jgi:hypothetical protein
MNHLTKVLLEDLLGDGKKKITAIYGGGFKPPTKGHFEVVAKAAEQNPEIDDIIIYVGGGERNGVAQGESIQIWELYKKYLPMKVQIEPVKAPVGDILRYAKDHPEEEVLWIIGARENNPEDFADISSRTRTLDKYPNLQLRVIQTAGGVSGTAARKAVKDNNKEQFFSMIPDIPEKQQVWDIVSPVVKEGIIDNTKDKLKKFILAVKQENQETKAAVGLIIKSAKGEIELSDEQKEQIGNQLKDILKLVGLTAIATLPGGFIVGALIKLFKAEHLITPSSFVNEVNIHQKALSQTEKEALELTYKNWDTFGGKECNNGFCDIFAKNLSKYLPGSKIMSTEDPRNETLGHVWVEYEGKYFDAETPNGVDSWKQLPWMIEFYSKNKSYPTDIENLNEVGEATLKPYKWKEVDMNGWVTYTEFTTENGTEYKVDLTTTNYIDNDLNNSKALEVEFSAKPKGAEGSSTKIIVNKGEMYRVMSTITAIIKHYIKKFKAKAIMYSPSKKSDEEDFGTQRDNLYKAFITKAIPGIKFEKDGGLITAILPDAINEDDPKKGTGKKPEGSGRRLYTDENPKDTVHIKFKTKEDIVDTLNKTSFKAKSHARQSQVINLIHQRVRAAYSKSKDPEVKSRLKRALDYIESRKESSKAKTQRLNKMKEASDPQAGTALPYGSGFAPVKELVTDTEVICDNCGWEWSIADGGKDLYICHKCGHDNTPKADDPFGLNELARQFVNETLKETWRPEESFVSLSKYMIDNGMNIKPLPKIKVISDDKDNASTLLGKTAYYNPTDKSITLYTMDRHPKDILRSFAHEMVHHEQNLDGRLNNINTTNTNENGALPEIEREAYEKGNMMLRNWEDSIKNV